MRVFIAGVDGYLGWALAVYLGLGVTGRELDSYTESYLPPDLNLVAACGYINQPCLLVNSDACYACSCILIFTKRVWVIVRVIWVIHIFV